MEDDTLKVRLQNEQLRAALKIARDALEHVHVNTSGYISGYVEQALEQVDAAWREEVTVFEVGRAVTFEFVGY